jgi:hypothetical protein
LASRQQSSLVPFFQGGPWLTQLSDDARANRTGRSEQAADAERCHLVQFLHDSPLRKGSFAARHPTGIEGMLVNPDWGLTTDGLCHRASAQLDFGPARFRNLVALVPTGGT